VPKVRFWQTLRKAPKILIKPQKSVLKPGIALALALHHGDAVPRTNRLAVGRAAPAVTWQIGLVVVRKHPGNRVVELVTVHIVKRNQKARLGAGRESSAFAVL
jgi:hypothetical protein